MSQENLIAQEVSKKASFPNLIFTVDSYSNGITFGQHKVREGQDPRQAFRLRMIEEDQLVRLRSRYALHKQNPLQELERQLIRLSKQGILANSTIYFGNSTDPFYPFEGKFDASIKFLDLFTRYTPGMLIVQTRSPLVVIAMPVLRKLGNHAAVTIGIETCDETSVRRYTPGLPKVCERLKAVSAMRHFGIEVMLQVNPVLPYGEWKGDAQNFAGILCSHADYININSITDGTECTEKRIRGSEVARLLARDRRFHYLRPDSADPLINAIKLIAPQKLEVPKRASLSDRQISIFAA